MSNTNATCSVCGKAYRMCLSCRDYARLHPWQLHTDTSEHYKVYQILNGNSCKIYTKEEAREMLRKVDLSDMDTYLPHVRNHIREIMDKEV